MEQAPLPELVDTIRPGVLANQEAPRIQATLRRIRDERSDYSLEFLAELSALEARDWLTAIDGIGKKTASVLLLLSFGLPLMPVDRHVERVAHRVGLIGPRVSVDDAHDLFLGMLDPDEMYEANVNLIQHGRKLCHARAAGVRGVPDPAALPPRRPEGALSGQCRPRIPAVTRSIRDETVAARSDGPARRWPDRAGRCGRAPPVGDGPRNNPGPASGEAGPEWRARRGATT